ncbi:MAG TPA: adenylyl-sulfate kinase [Methylocystis sp.]|jgi:shikimate kinase
MEADFASPAAVAPGFEPAKAVLPRKILVMGLPGAGKTTLAKIIAPRLKAVHFNADAVRQNVNKELGFSVEHRIEQARRMGWLCDRVTEAGYVAVADFVCPTHETREAFGSAFVVWVDRIIESRFEDTNRVFVPPQNFQIRVTPEGSPEMWAERVQHSFEQGVRSDRPRLF